VHNEAVKVIQIDLGTDRKRVYDFLLDFNSNLGDGPILPRFRDISAVCTPKAAFSTPLPYSDQNFMVFPLE